MMKEVKLTLRYYGLNSLANCLGKRKTIVNTLPILKIKLNLLDDLNK